MVTEPGILLCLALVSTLASPAFGESEIIQLLPGIITNTKVVVNAEPTASGQHFTIFYKTNDPSADEFLHATLEIRDEDNQIAQCQLEKHWISGGVEFSFEVASTFLEASKFNIAENAHSGRQPMPAFDEYWFYLRDFATHQTPATVPPRSSSVAPDIIKKLPGRIRKLQPGETADQIWLQLGLAAYRHSLGGLSYPDKDRFWLTSNQELEVVFEEAARPAPPSQSAGDDRKLIQATLFKNGRKIAASSK
jgi:hypothetical protein